MSVFDRFRDFPARFRQNNAIECQELDICLAKIAEKR